MTENIKVKALKSLLEKYTGKKVMLKEFEFEGGNFDNRIDPETLKKAYNYLLSKLTPESQDVLRKFVKGSTGWNRGSTIIKLAYHFGLKSLGKGIGRDEPITKSSLVSYSDRSLLKLIDNGDLVQQGKYYVPANALQETKPEIQNSEEIVSNIKSLIKQYEKITGEKVKIIFNYK